MYNHFAYTLIFAIVAALAFTVWMFVEVNYPKDGCLKVGERERRKEGEEGGRRAGGQAGGQAGREEGREGGKEGRKERGKEGVKGGGVKIG